MIGWGPILLTCLAVALLALVAIDASSGFHLSGQLGGHSVWASVHNALNATIQWLSHFGVQDWVLMGILVFLLAWAWVRAFAFVRLGTIQIADLTCDDDKLAPAGAKALLQQALGDHGLLPPSGVPSGSPSVASIADAISKAPIPQANWLGPLITLIPWPPSSTAFRISGNLRRTETDDKAPVCFAYELVCIGPQPCVRLGKAEGADPTAAITQASLDIYRAIAEAAPRMYPTWARWHSREALVAYREAVEIEADKRYEDAYKRYMAACSADPDNMIARLRAANCLERMATGASDPDQKLQWQVEALAAYTSIRIRRDAIFEAGFRASVLLSILASEQPEDLMKCPLLEETIARLERATSDPMDPRESWWTTFRRWMRVRRKQARWGRSQPTLNGRLEAIALDEARRARHHLRPFRTLVHHYRLRHRFEPTGRERRQLRKALGVSKLAQKARSEHRRGVRTTAGPSWARKPASLVRQFWWEMIVKWRYLACRWHIAGWTGHYNAACFYALLPRAAGAQDRPRGRGLRRRALKHLEFALDQADGALDCAYVRDEDPDLATLRTNSQRTLTKVLACMCPDELVIHYEGPGADPTWKLRASGDAVNITSDGYAWFDPVSGGDGRAKFRVRVFDENRWLRFEPRCNGGPAGEDPGYEVIPATLVTQEITVRLRTPKVGSEAAMVEAADHELPPPAEMQPPAERAQLTVTTAPGAPTADSGEVPVVHALSVTRTAMT